MKVPKSIYLLGHFIRADFPAFSDFKDNARLTSNVRSTFVSIDSAIPVRFGEEDNPIAEFNVIVRDTILLAPSNAKSLADIGDLLGFPKIQLGQTPKEEREIKENMARFRKERWSEFREYAIRDAQVCVRFAERIIQQSTKLFDSFKMPATLTSFGTGLLLLGWKNDGLDSNQILGREAIKERFFSKKDGYFKIKTVTPLKEEAYFNEAFITETYHGGRNEQFIFGIADEGQWRDHDLSSAYTTAMSLIGMPDWDNITNLTTLDNVGPLDLSFFSVDFEFPETVRFPTLPVRTANGIIFPRKGNSKCSAPELYLAQKLGALLTFRKGVHVPSDPKQPVFRDFIKECIEKRTAHKKGTFDNLFGKRSATAPTAKRPKVFVKSGYTTFKTMEWKPFHRARSPSRILHHSSRRTREQSSAKFSTVSLRTYMSSVSPQTASSPMPATKISQRQPAESYSNHFDRPEVIWIKAVLWRLSI